ncbi:MAG: phage tail tube protein [Shewanella sp.]
MADSINLKPGTLGKGTILNVALTPDEIKPTPGVITLNDPTVAAGDPSLVITAIPAGIKMFAGQYLSLVQTDGQFRIVQLNAVANAGDLALNIKPLLQAITNAATAKFPVSLAHRTQIGREGNTGAAQLETYDTGGWQYSQPTTKSESISTAGAIVYTDAGRLTAEYARDKDIPVWVQILRPPVSALFKHMGGIEGFAMVQNVSEVYPNNEYITGNIAFNMQGEPTRIDPVLA